MVGYHRRKKAQRTRRCSERQPADSLRNKWNVAGGWHPSLTFASGVPVPTPRQTMNDVPQTVAELVDVIASMPGAVAVVLGGSRALASNDAGSDWDLDLYYRGEIDLTALAARGTLFPPGSWGRLMNGGAWLRCGGEKVDVILRDLDVVEHWTRRAEKGEFERDALLGYLAGVPSYLLSAE